jgi:hypothetical protein
MLLFLKFTTYGWGERLIDIDSEDPAYVYLFRNFLKNLIQCSMFTRFVCFNNRNPRLKTVLSPSPTLASRSYAKHSYGLPIKKPVVGDIFEVSADGLAMVTTISKKIGQFGGALLVIDYGYEKGYGDTLQVCLYRSFFFSFFKKLKTKETTKPMKLIHGEIEKAVKQHKYHDILQDPGHVDITAHVNFSSFKKAIQQDGWFFCFLFACSTCSHF